jgi:C4-dicarboxylate transporter DctM subunit
MRLGAIPHWLGRAEGAVSVTVLALMTALPLIEMAGRRWGFGISGSIPIVQHATLWIGLLGAALAAGSDRLLALATGALLPERFRPGVRAVTNGLAAAITVWLLVASLDLVQVEREAETIVAWGIPTWALIAVMPVGFALIAGRLIWRAAAGVRGRALAVVVALAAAAGWLAPASSMEPLVTAGLIVIGCAAALGLPIYAAIGGAALLLFWREGVPSAAVPSEIYRLSASPMLPALPLFTLAGYLFSEGRASQRLMRLFTAVVGWMPGGLALVTVLLLAFFTPFTGASGVTILSMGGLLLPMLVKAKYPESGSVGLVTVSGSIGLLFPPSLPVILYGITAQTPIDRLFVAGAVPGVILIVAVAGWGGWRGWAAGAERQPFRVREVVAAAWQAKWELLLPVVVLAGLFGGFATLVEASALTVFYALVVECFVYRDLRVRGDLPRIAIECATLVGGFLIVLGVALGFTNYLIQAEVPMQVLAWVKGHIESPALFLLALNAFLIVVGAAMDIYSAILVVVPLITPLGAAYGIDPVHLGIVFLANMELGYLTPPMGENIFLAAYRFKQPLARIWASVTPYWLMLLVAVLVITYLPLVG